VRARRAAGESSGARRTFREEPALEEDLAEQLGDGRFPRAGRAEEEKVELGDGRRHGRQGRLLVLVPDALQRADELAHLGLDSVGPIVADEAIELGEGGRALDVGALAEDVLGCERVHGGARDGLGRAAAPPRLLGVAQEPEHARRVAPEDGALEHVEHVARVAEALDARAARDAPADDVGELGHLERPRARREELLLDGVLEDVGELGRRVVGEVEHDGEAPRQPVVLGDKRLDVLRVAREHEGDLRLVVLGHLDEALHDLAARRAHARLELVRLVDEDDAARR